MSDEQFDALMKRIDDLQASIREAQRDLAEYQMRTKINGSDIVLAIRHEQKRGKRVAI